MSIELNHALGDGVQAAAGRDGPAAWFIRFVGVDGVIGPLGFGGFAIPRSSASLKGAALGVSATLPGEAEHHSLAA
jgi:hypothetical protein